MGVAAIFVPHQDDEINLVGNILSKLTSQYEVYVIYSSLESDSKHGEVRKKEAINACKIYSIKEDHIIFLEYPDTPNKNGHHFFADGDTSIIQHLERIIKQLRPELIIGTDFDYHSDHRMLSLALDEAVRNEIKADNVYRPRYLKGFCYETAYYGVDDYSASNLQDTLVKGKLLGNVSYKWDDRISIKSNEPNGLIVFKKAYKALRCHKSQYAVLHARSIINGDNVFWEKRTDNLLLDKGVQITSSFGDVSKINDLKVIDTNDIITIDSTKIDYSKGVWRANASRAEISICWPGKVAFDRIVFHGNPEKTKSSNIKISIRNDESKDILAVTTSLAEYGRETCIIFRRTRCSSITLVCESADDLIELSEIEVYNGDNAPFEIVENSFKNKKNKASFIVFIDKLMFRVVSVCTKFMRKVHGIKFKY